MPQVKINAETLQRGLTAMDTASDGAEEALRAVVKEKGKDAAKEEASLIVASAMFGSSDVDFDALHHQAREFGVSAAREEADKVVTLINLPGPRARMEEMAAFLPQVLAEAFIIGAALAHEVIVNQQDSEEE